jgi:hypothetical protein
MVLLFLVLLVLPLPPPLHLNQCVTPFYETGHNNYLAEENLVVDVYVLDE